jgi:L-amino acid N-acyltransferase
MQLIHCDEARHSQAILDVFNEAIANSTALYDYKPRTIESMVAWFATKRQNDYPVIGLESDAGELLGFASYGAFRPHAAYKYSVEHSIYIHKDHRGKGLGAVLLPALTGPASLCTRSLALSIPARCAKRDSNLGVGWILLSIKRFLIRPLAPWTVSF